MGRLIVNLFEDMFVVVLAGNLLYLYYDGAWSDQIYWIELTEVALLYFIIAFGFVRFYFHQRGAK